MQDTKHTIGQLSASAASLLLAVLAGCASVGPATTREVPSTAPEALSRATPPTRRSPFAEPPGVYLAEVRQTNIGATICVSGWTATVRPSTSYTQSLKRLMLTRAGLDPKDAVKYELDHFVPLALGGHPRSEDNLWLQSWDGAWNARIKDQLERKLQVMVCAGQISLQAARKAVQNDWHAAYKRYVGADPAAIPRGVDEEAVVE